MIIIFSDISNIGGAWGKGFGRWQALILIYAHKLRRVQSVGDSAWHQTQRGPVVGFDCNPVPPHRNQRNDGHKQFRVFKRGEPYTGCPYFCWSRTNGLHSTVRKEALNPSSSQWRMLGFVGSLSNILIDLHL